ncbi:apolipoprotein D-like [Rhodnius prolixus]|uniref:apolipoprotein D-like n=1 Tax=Rhodnius prolixus TaxID=13249 RepID=UPI003D18EA6D
MLLLLILSIWVDTSSSQVPYLGSCPDLKTVDNFDQTRYMGKWYEAERYFSLFEFGGKCINSNYTDGIDSINIISKQTSTLTGIHSTIEGEVQKTPNGFLSKMNLKYPYLPMDAPYWILDTDYDNYSVVWSCSNFGLFSTRNAWILTRARFPILEIMEKAYNVIDKNFISRAYFIRTDQKNCPDDY